MAAIEAQTLPGVAPYLEDAERLATGAAPPFVRELRRAGREAFATLGFPTTQQEAWRFTSVASLVKERFKRTGGGTPVPQDLVAPYLFPAAAQLVFVNGRLNSALSKVESLPAGTIVASLAEAIERHADKVEASLGRLVQLDHPFVALNTAMLEDGAFVWVPKGAVVGTVHLLYVGTEEGGEAVASYPRNLIVTGEASQLSIVESYIGEGTYFTCGVTEMAVGASSVVDHYKVQRESRSAYHLATFQIEGVRDAQPSSHSISIGGGLVRNDVNAVLNGEGIECILNGLYLAEDRQLVDHHMRVEHAKPHCGSHELFKGILDGKARAVFNGLIHVHPGAQKTDAKQSNRNLLLSPDALANSNPQLEIFADDVKCTHGSTVGQLDEDAVFYLRSRGIGRDAARSLLTWAFASDIVERIKVEPVRKDLEELLFARLPQGDVVRQAV